MSIERDKKTKHERKNREKIEKDFQATLHFTSLHFTLHFTLTRNEKQSLHSRGPQQTTGLFFLRILARAMHSAEKMIKYHFERASSFKFAEPRFCELPIIQDSLLYHYTRFLWFRLYKPDKDSTSLTLLHILLL